MSLRGLAKALFLLHGGLGLRDHGHGSVVRCWAQGTGALSGISLLVPECPSLCADGVWFVLLLSAQHAVCLHAAYGLVFLPCDLYSVLAIVCSIPYSQHLHPVCDPLLCLPWVISAFEAHHYVPNCFSSLCALASKTQFPLSSDKFVCRG